MGRPLKKKNYQDPSAEGFQFDEVDAWIPGELAAEKCYITRQAGTYKFVVHSKSTSAEGLCLLVDKAAGSLAEGELVLTCTPFGGSSERIRSFSKHRVRTFNDTQYVWATEETEGKAMLDQYLSDASNDYLLTVGNFADEILGFYFQGKIGSIAPTNTISIPNNPPATISGVQGVLGNFDGPPETALFVLFIEPAIVGRENMTVFLTINSVQYELSFDEDFSLGAEETVFSLIGAETTPAFNYLLANDGQTIPIKVEVTI